MSVAEAPDVRLVVQALEKLRQLQLDASGNIRINLSADDVGLARDDTLSRIQDTYRYEYPSGTGYQYVGVVRTVAIVKPGYAEAWTESYDLDTAVSSTDYTDVKTVLFRPWYLSAQHFYIRMWVKVRFDSDATVYVRVLRGSETLWETSYTGSAGDEATLFCTKRVEWKDTYVQDLKLQAKVSTTGEQVTILGWTIDFGPDKPFIPIYEAIGSPGSAPPPRGVYLLGLDTDNNVARPVALDSAGRLRCVLA